MLFLQIVKLNKFIKITKIEEKICNNSFNAIIKFKKNLVGQYISNWKSQEVGQLNFTIQMVDSYFTYRKNEIIFQK